ncbi:hypothetical protein HWV62_41653 [Athelia sp. TMB]|nr:hypothetical protein HWV62_41653 [Athelia sp. TMB]
MSLQVLRQKLSKSALSQRAHPDSMTTWSASIRLGIFTSMELLWIILAVVCYTHVVEVANGQNLRIKTVWTTFAVFYQVAAAAPLAGVLAYAFSCEWNRRGPSWQSRSGSAVSTLTVGLVDRARYALSQRASLPFVVAFVASILVTVLGAVAPATVSITPTYLARDMNLFVGSFSPNYDSTPVAASAAFLSNALVFMEQVQNVSYGYDMPPGTLFGMPKRELLGQNLSWTYDVAYYNYTCSYRAPTYRAVSGIWPLSLITDDTQAFNGTIAWLLIGANQSTYGHNPLNSSAPWPVEFLSLESIPSQNTTYNGTGFSDIWPFGTPTVSNAATGVIAVNASYSNTASILLCDPNLHIQPHLVSLVDQVFTVGEALSGEVNISSPNSEFGSDGAGPILSIILNPLLGGSKEMFSARRYSESRFSVPSSPVDWAAGQLTLQALPNAAADNGSVNGVAYYDVPQAPEVIASNIGRYVQSAAKAYLAQGLLNSTAGTFAKEAQVLEFVTVMQTSLEQMIATIGLVVLIVVATIILLVAGIGNLPLTVSTVEAVLRGKERETRQQIIMNSSYESIPLKSLSEEPAPPLVDVASATTPT